MPGDFCGLGSEMEEPYRFGTLRSRIQTKFPLSVRDQDAPAKLAGPEPIQGARNNCILLPCQPALANTSPFEMGEPRKSRCSLASVFLAG